MALQNAGGSNTIYLSISDGYLVRQYKTPNANTQERVTKTGKLVYEERFKSLTGLITNVSVRENDYGKQWQITIQDDGEVYILSLPYSSRYAASFLKALPNVDLTKSVKLMAWSMIDKNDASKKVTGITMWHDDNKIAPYYTRETPNGLPQMKQVKVKGVTTWDDSDMMEFLEEKTKLLFTKTPF